MTTNARLPRNALSAGACILAWTAVLLRAPSALADSKPPESSPRAATASKESAFTGTWRANNRSLQYQGSNRYSLFDDIWRCDTCVPRIAIKADGHYHTIHSSLYYGSPYADTESVRAINDRSIEITDTLAGRVVARNRLTVSKDGRILTTDWKAISNSGDENHGTFESERTGKGPAGANKVSGDWHPINTNTTEDEITVTYKATADGLAMSDPTGDSYTAKFDGKQYPYNGDPGINGVSVKKIDENTIEETDLRRGKVIIVARMAIGPGRNTMKVTVEDKLRNATISWTATKL